MSKNNKKKEYEYIDEVISEDEILEEKKSSIFGDDDFDISTSNSNEEKNLRKKVKVEEDFLIDKVESQIISEEDKNIFPINVEEEMRKSFLEYAMSVIVSRALPDSRDGFKPVHRRIIYGMKQLGMTHKSPHKKSARIVGDVLGKYHPHGDSSVYEAMVRMARDFSMRYPLVDGHGNFGSIDGDRAAAMRYTEARLSKIAEVMVDSLNKNTVDFVDNYDGSDKEPEVLPSRIPNLFIMGSTGIAVGMATSIPPHSLSEMIDAAVYLARNEEASTEDLMQFVKAPDFPTGGIIMGTSGIKTAYETGKGFLTLRSKTYIEELSNGKFRIIVTEIPYMVNKSNMIEKIAQLVKGKIIDGITDLRDETSREGIRVVIEVKRDVVPEVVLNKLFKLTKLQTNFSMNMIALVDGKPQPLTLKKSLQVYLKHQINIVTRRTTFDFNKSENRAHIVRGLMVAINKIDKVISIIRSSKTDVEAMRSLENYFNLDDIQSKAIIEMKLSRLTGLAIDKLKIELNELEIEISSYKNILENKNVLIELIISEILEIKNKFSDERKTEIIEGSSNITDEDLIPKQKIAIMVSSKGYTKRVSLIEFGVQRRGGVGSKGASTYSDDDVKDIITTTTHTDLLIFTSNAKVYRIRAHQIPSLSKQAKGIPFQNIIPIEKNEKVISILPVNDYENKYLITVSKNGIVKKSQIDLFKRINRNGKRAFGLKEGDSLISAFVGYDNQEIIIGGSNGKVVRFDLDSVRSLSRTASGVKGMNLDINNKEHVVSASVVSKGQYLLLSIGSKGFGKKSAVNEYRKTSRGSKGVKTINISKAGSVKYVGPVKGDEDIMIITKKGLTIRTNLLHVATSSRGAKGVKIITLKENDQIKSVSLIAVSQIEEEVKKETKEISLDL
ncbi:MAG: DNA gyrase subunit A [Mollicutes bacterium PWAP]|nr:DNA gyrase subunit A [Mollicutes bacterium PWAP]